MTSRQAFYKKSLIRDIHMNKYRVFTDDEERKAFMLSRFGVDSMTKMSIDDLVKLRDFCLGKISDIQSSFASQRQLYKIKTLWNEKARDKGSLALLLFAKRICKRVILDIAKIRMQEAQKVILALEKMK